MVTYNTQNPIGSADPRDLYDNAQVVDQFTNSDNFTTKDRLGQVRKTIAGLDNDARKAIANAGYEFVGDYAAGIELTAYNQVVRDTSGEFWRVSGSTALPYTTTGAGLPEGGAFVSVGDAALRQELAAENGALLVRGSVIYVDTIADLQALPTSELVDGQQVQVKEYHAGSGVGGGAFYWDAGAIKSGHNGGTIIDPEAPFPANFSATAGVEAWYGASNAGTGCWVALGTEAISAHRFGKQTVANPYADSVLLQALFDYCATSRVTSVIDLPDVEYLLRCDENIASASAAVILDGLDSVHIRGAGYTGALKPSNLGSGAAAFSLFRIQNCRNLEISGFRIDGDYANFSGAGANRNTGFTLTTFDTETLEDLSTIKGINIHHVESNNIGGFVWGLRRTSGSHALPLESVKINDNFGIDSALANNVIGLSICLSGEIKRNRFRNTPSAESPFPSLFVDVSRGCEGVEVSDNGGSYFVFGMKSEIAPEGSLPFLPSKNITFKRNRLIETGDPNSLTAGEGSVSGGTYGIKLHSSIAYAEENTITARTLFASGGGLNSGIFVDLRSGVEGAVTVSGNSISGSNFGIVHDRVVSDGMAPFTARSNTIANVGNIGIILNADSLAEKNTVRRSAGAAISLQTSNNARALRNRAIDCGGPGNPVMTQGDGGASTTSPGYFEFIDNDIIETRATGRAQYGYFLQTAENYTNRYRIEVGETSGLAEGNFFRPYIGIFERSDVKCSGQVNGGNLSHVFSHNIASITSVDSSTVQINYRRKVESQLPQAILSSVTSGKRAEPFGATEDYFRVRFFDTSTGSTTTPGIVNLLIF